MFDPKNLIPLIAVLVTVFVLVRARHPSHVLITSIGFGLSGALLYAAIFLSWALGGIPFRLNASLLALGLTILNFVIAIFVVRWMARHDIPPEDAPPLV